MSLKRTCSALFLMAATALAVIYDGLFISVVVFLTIMGLYEFFNLIKRKGIPIYSYVGIFIGVAIPISIFFEFELTKNWELLFTVLTFLIILFMQFARKDNQNAVVGIATTLFAILYVSWFFSFLIKIRQMLPAPEGMKLLAFILIVTKLGDVGALIIGSRFGKHPLIPRISPNKSLEGALGSLGCSIFGAVVFRMFLPDSLHFPLWQVALMGAFFGAVGQLGDLSESLIKRDCQAKDSGTFMPGLGGALDVMDSLLFSAPAFYLYMSAALKTL